MRNKYSIFKYIFFLILNKQKKFITKNKLIKEGKISDIKKNKKYNQIIKNNNIINKSYIFLYFLIIIFLPYSLSMDNFKKLRKINYISTISLTISQQGNIQILSDDFNNLPDRIFLDNEEMTNIEKIYDFSDSTIIVKLIWYNEFTNMSSLFSKCYNILTVDFSQFNSSLVNDMSQMFYQCYNLKEINFQNFNTTKVENMNSMFLYCSSLISLDISSFDTSSVTSMGSMFLYCSVLNSIDLSNFNTNSLTDISKMFKNCAGLETFDFSNFDSSKITNCNSLFHSCSNLKNITFNNFNTSSITDMSYMFNDCKELLFLDLSNFDMSNVEIVEYMFADCQKIEKIEFNNKIKMSKINSTVKMFKNCKKLISLDLSFIDTSQVTIMDYMFNNCNELQILNIPNFNTISVTSMVYIFSNCKNLQYLNGYSLVSNDLDSEFERLPDNLTYCINSYYAENIIDILDAKNGENNCLSICQKLNLKIVIYDADKCLSNCIHDDTYQLEYNNKCYFQCPPGTKLSKIIGNLCLEENEIETTLPFIDTTIPISTTIIIEDKSEITTISVISTIPEEENNIPSEYKEDTTIDTELGEKSNTLSDVTEIVFSTLNSNDINLESEIKDTTKIDETDEITYNSINTENIINSTIIENEENNYFLISNNCTINNFLNKLCEVENNSIDSINSMIEIIKYNIINKNMKSLLENITNGEKQEFIIENGKIIYQITSTYNQHNKNYTNISYIKLGPCENKLKNIYNIEQNDTIILFKIDYYEDGLLFPIINYEYYHPKTFEKLNLDICEDDIIEIFMPIEIEEDEIYLHDPKNEYYNDKCCPTKNKNGPDIILIDRQEEFINKNLSVCENNCEYGGYNIEMKQVICECKLKKEINMKPGYKIDKKKFFGKFKDIKNMMNLYILKCYKIILNKEGFIYNIGSYILLGTILFYIFSIFIFITKAFNYFNIQLKDIMKNKQFCFKNNNNNYNNNGDIKIYRNKDDLNIRKAKTQKILTNKRIKNNVIRKPKKKMKKFINKNVPPVKKRKKKKKNNTINKINSLKESINKSYLIKDKLINSNINLDNKDMNIYHKKPILKLDNIYNNKSFLQFKDYELNSLSYNDALKYDKRTYLQYYISLLKTKHLLIFTFLQNDDYNSTIIKICLFFFSFDLYFTINALFYTDSTIHEIYEESGAFNFIYHIPQIFYSSIISAVINVIVKNLSLSQKNLLQLKNEKNIEECPKKIEQILKCLKIKFTLFYIISFVFLLLFWYYITCFCVVYKNTQIHLIKDTIISFGLSLLYPFGINLIPGFLRIPALKDTQRNKKCLYGISKIIQII